MMTSVCSVHYLCEVIMGWVARPAVCMHLWVCYLVIGTKIWKKWVILQQAIPVNKTRQYRARLRIIYPYSFFL